MKNKESHLKKLLHEALAIAGDAWELANAYAGGDSESADQIAKDINKLEKKIEYFNFNS
jgi:hypothetical protein